MATSLQRSQNKCHINQLLPYAYQAW